jgi:hypothetical protein
VCRNGVRYHCRIPHEPAAIRDQRLWRIEPDLHHAPHVRPHVVQCIHHATQPFLISGASAYKSGPDVDMRFRKPPGRALENVRCPPARIVLSGNLGQSPIACRFTAAAARKKKKCLDHLHLANKFTVSSARGADERPQQPTAATEVSTEPRAESRPSDTGAHPSQSTITTAFACIRASWMNLREGQPPRTKLKHHSFWSITDR